MPTLSLLRLHIQRLVRGREASELRPLRAMTSPLWLGALALLILNDHVLKGSGLLPGWFTGKLSDFAGMIVAPALFAALSGVRRRGGWLAAHVAVGFVFAAIQLSAPFAAMWSRAMGLLGMPWAITMDPTDLVALAMLPLAHYALLPVVQRPDPEAYRRLARVSAGGVGLVASVATSPAEPFGEFYPDIYATTFIHNASDSDIEVLIRPLRETVALDCAAISEDPGGLIPDSAFDQGVLWTMPARTNIAANDDGIFQGSDGDSGGCSAVHISGDRFDAMILFWDDDIGPRFLPGQYLDGEPPAAGGVSLNFADDGEFVEAQSTGVRIHFAPRPDAYPGVAECVAPQEAERLDWIGFRSGEDFTLETVEWAPDSCARLEWAEGSKSAYLCMPPSQFPFVSGDQIEVYAESDMLRLRDAQGSGRRMYVVRGSGTLNSEGIEVRGRGRFDCGWAVDRDCAAAYMPAELLVSHADYNGVIDLETQDVQWSLDGEERVSLHLSYAADRGLVDRGCANGSEDVGPDMEFSLRIEPMPAP